MLKQENHFFRNSSSFLIPKKKDQLKQVKIPQEDQTIKRRLITRLVRAEDDVEDFDQFGKKINPASYDPNHTGYQQFGSINSQQEVVPEFEKDDKPEVIEMKKKAAHLFTNSLMKREKPEEKYQKAYEKVTELKTKLTNLLRENQNNDEVLVDTEMLNMTRGIVEIMDYIKQKRYNEKKKEIPDYKEDKQTKSMISEAMELQEQRKQEIYDSLLLINKQLENATQNQLDEQQIESLEQDKEKLIEQIDQIDNLSYYQEERDSLHKNIADLEYNISYLEKDSQSDHHLEIIQLQKEKENQEVLLQNINDTILATKRIVEINDDVKNTEKEILELDQEIDKEEITVLENKKQELLQIKKLIEEGEPIEDIQKDIDEQLTENQEKNQEQKQGENQDQNQEKNQESNQEEKQQLKQDIDEEFEELFQEEEKEKQELQEDNFYKDDEIESVKIEDLGLLRKNYETFQPKDDFYMQRMIEETDFLKQSYTEIFKHISQISIKEGVDYYDQNLQLGIEHFDKTKQFLISFIINKQYLDNDLEFMKEDLNYFQKGLEDVLDIYDLKDLQEEVKLQFQQYPNDVEQQKMEKNLESVQGKYMKIIDEFKILMNNLILNHGQIEEQITDLRNTLNQPGEPDLVQQIKQAVELIPQIQQKEKDIILQFEQIQEYWQKLADMRIEYEDIFLQAIGDENYDEIEGENGRKLYKLKNKNNLWNNLMNVFI